MNFLRKIFFGTPVDSRGDMYVFNKLSADFSGTTGYVYIDDVELLVSSDPNNPNTDGDQLTDGDEILQYRTNPVTPYTDSDFWTDYEEVKKYYTNPYNGDTDGDNVRDDEVDVWPFDGGDFYWKVEVDGVIVESTQPGEEHNTPHEIPNWQHTWNVADDKSTIAVTIELWDDNLIWDDRMDISDILQSPFIGYYLRRASWDSGISDDYIGDANGYRHVSGSEDGSTDRDEDDCELWFDITQNDYDNDDLTWWEEVNIYNTNPKKPSLLLEIDYMSVPGFDETMLTQVLNEAKEAFGDIQSAGFPEGIELKWVIDERNLPLDDENPNDNDNYFNFKEISGGVTVFEGREYLEHHRNSDYSDFVHVVFAHRHLMTTLGGYVEVSTYTVEPTTSPSETLEFWHSGVLIFVETIFSVTNDTDEIEDRESISKGFIHEVGHTIGGLGHETDIGLYDARVDPGNADTLILYNVMLSGDVLGVSTINLLDCVRGTGNQDRLKGAYEYFDQNTGKWLYSGPRFSIESIEQMNLRKKISVNFGWLLYAGDV